MISRCANPACLAEFHHREGRLFRFPKRAKGHCANTHSVQHFWLCGRCAKSYSLEYIENRGVALRPGERQSSIESHHFIAAA